MAQAILRRMDGELLLLQKQMDHLRRVINEFRIYSSLLLAAKAGSIIRDDISLVDAENKSAALKFRAVEFKEDLVSILQL